MKGWVFFLSDVNRIIKTKQENASRRKLDVFGEVNPNPVPLFLVLFPGKTIRCNGINSGIISQGRHIYFYPNTSFRRKLLVGEEWNKSSVDERGWIGPAEGGHNSTIKHNQVRDILIKKPIDKFNLNWFWSLVNAETLVPTYSFWVFPQRNSPSISHPLYRRLIFSSTHIHISFFLFSKPLPSSSGTLDPSDGAPENT